jgi:phosphoribosylpyrophosphate synthetase
MPIAILLGTISTASDDRLHALVQAARAGDAVALSTVIDQVRLAALDLWPDIHSAVVAGVPGHRPGPANPLVLAVGDELAGIRGWDYAPDALRRISPAPEAKAGGPRDSLAEASTLEWVGAPRGASIVLVDDVVRSGSTLRACATTIHAAGDHRPIFAIAIAARGTTAS